MSCGILFQKSFSPLFLAAILNLCVKHKNEFISVTVQDRAILTKFLIPRISGDSSATFFQKSFSATLNFCVKSQNAFVSKKQEIENFNYLNVSFISLVTSLPCGTECCSRMVAGLRPSSRKKRHLCLAVASGCPLVVHYEISSYFLVAIFKPYPSAVIQWGGRVGLFSVPHGKLVAYKSYI